MKKPFYKDYGFYIMLIAIVFLVYVLDNKFNPAQDEILAEKSFGDYLQEISTHPYINDNVSIGIGSNENVVYFGTKSLLNTIHETSFRGLYETKNNDVSIIVDVITNESYNSYTPEEDKIDMQNTYLHEVTHLFSLKNGQSTFEKFAYQMNMYNPYDSEARGNLDRRRATQIINETNIIISGMNLEPVYLDGINFTDVFYENDYYSTSSYYNEIVARVFAYCVIEDENKFNVLVFREGDEFCEYFNLNMEKTTREGSRSSTIENNKFLQDYNEFHYRFLYNYLESFRYDNQYKYILYKDGNKELVGQTKDFDPNTYYQTGEYVPEPEECIWDNYYQSVICT